MNKRKDHIIHRKEKVAIGQLIFLYFSLYTSCMPEEGLPIRNMGDPPTYFIECYCMPGEMFALTVSNVLPVSEYFDLDLSQQMSVRIIAQKPIDLHYSVHREPGSDFLYNYGSESRFNSTGIDTLYLEIVTDKKEKITAKTTIPDDVAINSYRIDNDGIAIHFYTSTESDQNYYIYGIELQRNDSIFKKEVRFLDYSHYYTSHKIEKKVTASSLAEADKIILSLKRITKANYEYQVSLHGANSANQSSITSPVPLKGNLAGAMGIFTCYTEDKQTITINEL